MVKTVLLGVGGLFTAAFTAARICAWVGDTPLRVRDTGPKSAPALILIHGFGSSLETWEPWAQSLNADYRVVRLDLPGSTRGWHRTCPSGALPVVRSPLARINFLGKQYTTSRCASAARRAGMVPSRNSTTARLMVEFSMVPER